MKIGRTRLLTASRIAAVGSAPPSRTSCKARSTIRIGLLTTVPIRITKPSIVSTSSGWKTPNRAPNQLRSQSPSRPPTLPSGTDAITTPG